MIHLYFLHGWCLRWPFEIAKIKRQKNTLFSSQSDKTVQNLWPKPWETWQKLCATPNRDSYLFHLKFISLCRVKMCNDKLFGHVYFSWKGFSHISVRKLYSRSKEAESGGFHTKLAIFIQMFSLWPYFCLRFCCFVMKRSLSEFCQTSMEQDAVCKEFLEQGIMFCKQNDPFCKIQKWICKVQKWITENHRALYSVLANFLFDEKTKI